MEWFKKHSDAAMVIGAILSSTLWIGAILSSTLWMNGKFNELEKDIAVIKGVLLLKQILPPELAKHEAEK